MIFRGKVIIIIIICREVDENEEDEDEDEDEEDEEDEDDDDRVKRLVSFISIKFLCHTFSVPCYVTLAMCHLLPGYEYSLCIMRHM